MVLGATGFIGRPLVRWLADQGHEVFAVSRNPDLAPADPAVHAQALDRNAPDALASAAARQGVQVVIDLLAMTLPTSLPLINALSGRVARYVLASSGDVYRQYGALHRLEAMDAARHSLDEAAPLRTRAYPYRTQPPRSASVPDAWMDDYDKIPIERAAAALSELSAVVVRLPMVYGPGDRQRRFAWAIRPMLTKAPVIEIDAQWADWRSSYGFVNDVAAGLGLAATHPAAAGRTYNVGPPEAANHTAWAARFADFLGWRGEIVAIPRARVSDPVRQALDGLDLAWPMVTDTSRIRAELAYREPTPPAEALRLTVEDEMARSKSVRDA